MVKKAENDPIYFEKLYEYFFPKVYNFIYHRVNSEELAEDLVSDIFIKVLNNISKCKNKEQFQSWVFTIARNYLIDFYRRKGKNTVQNSKEDDFVGYIDKVAATNNNPQNNPEEALITKFNKEEVGNVISTLSKHQQDVIILRFFEDLKIKEIAEVMNKNEGAVKGLLYRGIKALTSELQKRGVIS